MIVSLAGKPIREPEEVLGASFYLSGGDHVRMTFLRGGELHSISFQCAETPETTEGSSARP
jgi:hypothetical protein